MSHATYHVEIRFKNGPLMKAICECYPPTDPRQKFANFKSLAKDANVSYGAIMRLLACQSSPFENRFGKGRGEPTETAANICRCLGLSFDEAFPDELYSEFRPGTISGYIPADKILSLSDPQVQKMLPSIPAQDYNKVELKDAVRRVIATLPPSRQQVIAMRFGLDGKGERTLDEVGEDTGLTRERIRQIEKSALRKLRYPVRARQLRPFLDTLEAQ